MRQPRILGRLPRRSRYRKKSAECLETTGTRRHRGSKFCVAIPFLYDASFVLHVLLIPDDSRLAQQVQRIWALAHTLVPKSNLQCNGARRSSRTVVDRRGERYDDGDSARG